MREQFVNDAATTLDGAINSGVVSVVVTDGSVFPSEGDFRVIVNDEIMLVTARSGNTLTVVRGQENTTAASHSDLDDITAIATEGNLETFTDDAIGVGILRPGGFTGRTPYRLLDDSSATLTSSDFSWINQGTSSVANDPAGGMTVTVNETTGDWKLLTKSMPTPPFILTAHIVFGPGITRSASGTLSGIGARDSSSGRFQIATLETGDEITFWQFTSPSVFNANSATHNPVDFFWDEMWMQFEDDNVNIYARASFDSLNWRLIGQDTRTAWLASADQLVWAFNPRGAADKLIHLNAWVET